MSRAELFERVIITGIGLTPWWWFRHGDLMKTPDLRLPTTASEWWQYLYAWNDQIGTGAQSILDASSLLFRSIEALVSLTGWGLPAIQRLVFTGWFLLGAWSMARLGRAVFSGPFVATGRVVAVSFYMFNLWQATYWTAFKPPVVAGYAILPRVLAWLIEGFEGRRLWRSVVVGVASLSLLVAVGGNNPTEFVQLLLPLLLCVLLYAWRTSAPGARRAAAILGALMLALHAFWWVPEGAAYHDQRANNAPVETERQYAAGVLSGTSQRTSFANVARLQGEWTWESGWGEPYVPYDRFYREHPVLWLQGWCLLALVYAGMVWGPPRHTPLFILLAVIGVVLSMGVHSPFGGVYRFLIRWIPGFWAIRSPYYKFGLMVCLGYSVLLGAAALACCRWLARYWRPIPVGVVIGSAFVLLHATYAFPVTTGRMFIAPEERRALAPARVTVPAYVHDSSAWLAAQPGEGRVWTVPGEHVWQTRWGYNGVGSILQEFTTRPVLFRYNPIFLLTTQAAQHPSQRLVEPLTDGLRDLRSRRLGRWLTLLGVEYVLLERDLPPRDYRQTGREVDHYAKYMPDHLTRQRDLEPVTAFGQWSWYRVASGEVPRAWATDALWLADGPVEMLFPWSYSPAWTVPAAIIWAEDLPSDLLTQAWTTGLIYGVLADATRPATPWVQRATASGAALELVWVARRPPVEAPEHPTAVSADWRWAEGFGPPMSHEGRTWRWLLDPGHNRIEIDHSGAEALPAIIRLVVRSPGIERSLMLYWNGELSSAFPIAPDRPSRVATPVVLLQPGRNLLKVYTPAASTIVEGVNRTFAVAAEGSTHAPTPLRVSLEIPATARYRAWFIPVAPGPQRAIERDALPVSLDGLRLEVPRQEEDLFGPVELPLTAGPHTLDIMPEACETYQGILQRPSSRPRPTALPTRWIRHSPVEGSLAVSADRPHLIVFHESFHPQWRLSVEGRPVGRHLRVQGYANAWWVDRPGTYTAALRFMGQRWVTVGALISLMGVVAVVVVSWRWR